MEKLGIQNQELLAELKTKYSDLRSRQHALSKTASASAGPELDVVEQEMAQVKARIDELEAQ